MIRSQSAQRRLIATPWREGTVPPVGHVVEVWWRVGVVLATWTGQEWRTVDGRVLEQITHWRERG